MRSEISISEVTKVLIFCSEKYDNMLLMGDPKNHHLKDFIDSNNFENLINKPTYFKSTLPTTIDLFLTSKIACFMKSLKGLCQPPLTSFWEAK